MMRFLPGDPVAAMLRTSGASPARIAEVRRQLGLEQPVTEQYVRFLSGAVRGDLGRSIFTGRPVVTVILEQLPATVQLATSAMIIGVALGILLGTISALRVGSWVDHSCMVFAATGVSMPSFWFGLLMIYFFSFKLVWLPSTGQGGLERLVMPATVLGLGVAATVARLTRSNLLEVMRQDYITTARAKGLSERLVIFGHALKNALIPVVTMIGLEFGWMLGGTVVTETVFSRQGLGRLAIQAVLQKDFPLVQGTVLFAAVFYLFANLVVDIAYGILDPRIGTQ
jgi:ABC-type dipeptide/oligopeptide/nickel transport system permease component